MTDRELVHQALDMLKQAKDSVADWGAYASEYFQHKHNLQGSIDDIQAQITVLSERLAQPECQYAKDVAMPEYRCVGKCQYAQPDAYGYASRLAVAIWEQHYMKDAPQWKPLDDLMGVLTQIDNMTSGLTRLAQPEQEHVIDCPRCGHCCPQQPVQEPVAAWMIQRGYATGHGDTTEDLLKELEWQIAENWTSALVKGVEGEREACAGLLEENAMACENPIYRSLLQANAAAIRARGNA